MLMLKFLRSKKINYRSFHTLVENLQAALFQFCKFFYNNIPGTLLTTSVVWLSEFVVPCATSSVVLPNDANVDQNRVWNFLMDLIISSNCRMLWVQKISGILLVGSICQLPSQIWTS